MKKNIYEDVIVGVVTYNPDLENLRKMMNKAAQEGYRIIVIDNSSDNVTEIREMCATGFLIIENNENYGVACALNQIMETALTQNYNWILTLDQDSDFPFEKLEILYRNICEDVGIIAPIIHDMNGDVCILNENIKGIQEVEKCITSGALTNGTAWKKAGRFDENMFIDGVDFDFCRRLKKNGYKILVNGDILLEHQLGEYRYKRILLWNFKYNWHSPLRTYYIIRNMIYMERKYHDRHFVITTLRMTKRFFEIVFLFENKCIRFIYFWKAIKDGFGMKISMDGAG